MKLQKKMLLLVILVLAAGLPSAAQVNKAAARTNGLSCGACGAIVEVYLKRMPGVDKITMSMSKEILQVTYRPGASFRPEDIRDALDKSSVQALQFQISAQGLVQEQTGKQFFVAGKDKFLLVASPTSPKVALGAPISVEGIVNDHTSPMELTILSVKPPKQ